MNNIIEASHRFPRHHIVTIEPLSAIDFCKALHGLKNKSYEELMVSKIRAAKGRAERLQDDGDLEGASDEISYRNSLMHELTQYRANLRGEC